MGRGEGGPVDAADFDCGELAAGRALWRPRGSVDCGDGAEDGGGAATRDRTILH